MFVEILQYGFLVIFFATAIIGLASLPGWIPIPEWYRKKIFIALILEVVAVIIFVAKQEMTSEASGVPRFEIAQKNWVALDKKATRVNPEIKISTNDTSITQTLGADSFSPFSNLSSTVSNQGLEIKNENGDLLTVVSKSQLESAGLFNSFETAKNEISSTENHSYARWKRTNRSENPTWRRYGKYLDPFNLQIFDDGNETKYEIKKENEVLFKSDDSSKDLFSVDNRIIHFYEYEQTYYLLRINEADLTDSLENYVHVLQIRLEPNFR